jgi:Fe-S-cluster containining protein
MTIDQALDTYERHVAYARADFGRFVRRSKFQVACAEGCAWCCCLWVPVARLDALTIARYLIRRYMSTEVVQKAVIAQRDHADRFQARDLYLNPDPERERELCSSWMRKKIACPFLVGRRCSIYPVRPIPCWSHLAQSPAAPQCCEQDLDGLADSVPCLNPEPFIRRAVNYEIQLSKELWGRLFLPEPMAIAMISALKTYEADRDTGD